jgi:hypothetical protein
MNKFLNTAHRAKNWIFQEKHRTHAQAHWQKAKRAFTDHPAEVEENYFEHLLFTLGMAFRLIYAGVALIIHGIFPFLFTRTASHHVMALYGIMRKRRPKDTGCMFGPQWNDNGI